MRVCKVCLYLVSFYTLTNTMSFSSAQTASLLTILILSITFRRRVVQYHTSGCYLTSDSCLCLITIMLHFHSGFLKLCIFCTGLPIILVGCKKDLRCDPHVIEKLRKTNQRPVTPEEPEVGSIPSICCVSLSDNDILVIFRNGCCTEDWSQALS